MRCLCLGCKPSRRDYHWRSSSIQVMNGPKVASMGEAHPTLIGSIFDAVIALRYAFDYQWPGMVFRYAIIGQPGYAYIVIVTVCLLSWSPRGYRKGGSASRNYFRSKILRAQQNLKSKEFLGYSKILFVEPLASLAAWNQLFTHIFFCWSFYVSRNRSS